MRHQWPTPAIALSCAVACGETAAVPPLPPVAEAPEADVTLACLGADQAGSATLQAALDAAPAGTTVVACDLPDGHPGPLVIRRDVTLVGPATVHGGPGPAVHVLSGHVRLVGLTLRGGTGAVEPRLDGDTHGGVVAAWEADALIIEDSVLSGGTADWGGCVSGPRQGPLSMHDTTVSDCAATKVGGGVWIRQGGLADSTVTASSAPYGGGVAVRSLEAAGGGVALPGSVIRGNRASVQGGGLLVTGPATVTGGRVERNESEQGGGVLFSDATGGWVDGTAAENTATVGGGGVFVRGGQVRLSGVNLQNNRSTGAALPDGRGVGGGLWLSGDTDTQATLDDCVIEDNEAAWGGGLLAAGAGLAEAGPLLTLVGGSVAANTAVEGGGAAATGARLQVDAIVFSGNTASSGGGAWLSSATLTAADSAWSDNTPDDIRTPAGSFDGTARGLLTCDDTGCRAGDD